MLAQGSTRPLRGYKINRISSLHSSPNRVYCGVMKKAIKIIMRLCDLVLFSIVALVIMAALAIIVPVVMVAVTVVFLVLMPFFVGALVVVAYGRMAAMQGEK